MPCVAVWPPALTCVLTFMVSPLLRRSFADLCFAPVHPPTVTDQFSTGLHVRFVFHGILLELVFARTIDSHRFPRSPGKMVLPPDLTFVLTFIVRSRELGFARTIDSQRFNEMPCVAVCPPA